jgi:hypothetical protein
MGAEREPGETTTCCTPPSTKTPTAILAAAIALSKGAASEASEAEGAAWDASGAGSFNEVTKPVCHPDALSLSAGKNETLSHLPSREGQEVRERPLKRRIK